MIDKPGDRGGGLVNIIRMLMALGHQESTNANQGAEGEGHSVLKLAHYIDVNRWQIRLYVESEIGMDWPTGIPGKFMVCQLRLHILVPPLPKFQFVDYGRLFDFRSIVNASMCSLQSCVVRIFA